jgi:REP element-mobilizing transposase RayT
MPKPWKPHPERPVLAFHVIFSTHGFWLPNDPRGSGSYEVRAEHLRPFGYAYRVGGKQSVARKPHDRTLRLLAKEALMVPEVRFTGLQARAVMRGIAQQTAVSQFTIYAAAIMPQHVHLVVARPRYSIEQMVRLCRQAATMQLLKEQLHPFADWRDGQGRLVSVWGRRLRKQFLFDDADITRSIRYVEQNPIKDGYKKQKYNWVTPY